MEKIRVHALAKDLGVSNKDLVQILHEQGIEVSSHLASIEADEAELIRDHVQSQQGSNGDQAQAESSAQSVAPAAPRTPAKSAAKAAKKGKDEAPAPPAAQPAAVEPAAKSAPSASAPAAPAPAASPAPKPPPAKPAPAAGTELMIKPPVIVKALADAMDCKAADLVRELLTMNVFASINQPIDIGVAERLVAKRGYKLVLEKRDKHSGTKKKEDSIDPEDIVHEDQEIESRPPVVAFLGHVDHGKTSLQDAIRRTNVTAGEAGGITQHIGASIVERNGNKITFIDTPGHEAFTAMRARGAQTTDIVVLVVAADDGFMPQTVEALQHARAAGVAIIVAINKCDLPSANPDRVLQQMQQHDLMSEDWGGEVAAVRVSATTGDGLDELLERITLEAEMLELKANAKLPGRAVVIEAQLEQGLGPTAHVLVKNGTLKVGKTALCGQYYGRIRALIDTQGKRVKSAGPSMPVKVVGLNGVPEAGSQIVLCEDEKQARRLTAERELDLRTEQLTNTRQTTLENLFEQIEKDNRDELKVILKTDVQGTAEAIADALNRLSQEKIDITIILQGIGGITENDVRLAAASQAIILGFHVRVNAGVNKLAKAEGVEIRLYSIIYELVADVRASLEGMLKPEMHEQSLGQAEILQIFAMSKGGKICGCSVGRGVVRVGAKARVYRDKELIYNGSISSLRRFQDDVKEVRQGFECGIRLDNFNDFEEHDIIDVYDFKEVPATL